MEEKKQLRSRVSVVIVLCILATVASSHLRADTGTCGGQMITLPFTDVAGSPFFCQIAAAYFSGLTNGTSATTFSPNDPVPREQMAAFMTRTLDQSLKRGGRRAALNQWWIPQTADNLQLIDVGDGPAGVQSDGSDLWVANFQSGTVSRVRASDGKLLETWTGAANALGVLVAMGKVFVTGAAGGTAPGSLYMIDPSQPPGNVTTVTSNLGNFPRGIAFDGARIWTANSGSVSIISPGVTIPWNVDTITNGFGSLTGAIYDGSNIWVSDSSDFKFKKLDSNGNIIQSTIIPGGLPGYPAFDGTNIYVPDQAGSYVAVIRASTGQFLTTLRDNGLVLPISASFDGERIFVTSFDRVSLWRASDLTPLGFLTFSGVPSGSCSDGINFWFTINTGKLARF